MTELTKPFSQACANNQKPILDVISRYLVHPGTVLEIGSGTGQHAVYMARHLPHLQWQPSDLSQNLEGIEAWRREAGLSNVLPPLSFNVMDEYFQPPAASYLFTANTLHIMPWTSVVRFFERIPELLRAGGIACMYGPFNYEGRFTSESNARFDHWLKSIAPHQGIRDFEAIAELAEKAGLFLLEDCTMPANNRTLVWQGPQKKRFL